uniref:Dienelactone hydrolase domain-containing protein n=1 Tax=Phaeomonas parva TaxID=124430 RepID=A0A7S1TW15_9STRA|mmetsp:Transcript_1986/g.5954  ORF Transcript_1986/g.5954 Transcript_1986/m.5954 type:complete len:214 (+) Transcript_1986:229-870(+)
MAAPRGDVVSLWAKGAPLTAAAVFYPARYDAGLLETIRTPICAVFGEDDEIAGAAAGDRDAVSAALRGNAEVSDFHVHVAAGEGHGFAHRGLHLVDGVARFNAAAEGLGVSPARKSKVPSAGLEQDYPVDMADRAAAAAAAEPVEDDEWGDFGKRRPDRNEKTTTAFGRSVIEKSREASEAAFMVATAWLDTYMRVVLPTTGVRSRDAGDAST